MPVAILHLLSLFWPPVVLSHTTGIRSTASGKEIEGWLIACPLSARQMMRLPTWLVYHKITQTGRLAERLGANILGLGAYTSVVGDGGHTVSQRLDLPVTTGDSYTAALAIQAIKHLGRQAGISLERSTVAVVGATGAIGSACARALAPQVKRTILVGKRQSRLDQISNQVCAEGAKLVTQSTQVSAIKEADLVITATSSASPIIYPQHLKAGAIVCDVALPRDVSPQVVKKRDDVLVVDGGLAEMPGGVSLGFDYRLPPELTFGCMAETMVLAFEGRFESYTMGKDLNIDKVWEIERMASRHGFRLSGYRSFNRPLTDAQIQTVLSRLMQTARASLA
jgi:predicted amino acid dehydrogenase